jgi:hypothetical protein
MSNVATFLELVFLLLLVGLNLLKNGSSLVLILKKTWMPKIKSPRDLGATYSYGKNTVGAT